MAEQTETIAVTVTVDTDELRRWAEKHADAGHHGVAHVLFKAASDGEALTEQALREARAEERERVRLAIPNLASLVRTGLWGANVPIGMDLPVTRMTTDESIVAAQDEFVRRALAWAVDAYREKARAALAEPCKPPALTSQENDQ